MVALPFLLHWGIYHYELQEIRKEVKAVFKAGLRADELDHFEWTTNEYAMLEWAEQDHEFYHQGLKYDVYSIEKKGDRIYVSAWLDHEESDLKQRFSQLLEKHQPKPNDKEQGFFQLLKNQFLPSAKVLLTPVGPELNFAKRNFDLIHWDLERVSPPPRL